MYKSMCKKSETVKDHPNSAAHIRLMTGMRPVLLVVCLAYAVANPSSGDHDAKEVNPPNPSPTPLVECKNNGILVRNPDGSAKCYCTGLFTGDDCGTRLCLNGGSLDADTDKCLCEGGFEGEFCEKGLTTRSYFDPAAVLLALIEAAQTTDSNGTCYDTDFTALSAALSQYITYKSPVYVITDALPNDGTQVDNVYLLLPPWRSPVYFLYLESECATKIDEPAYRLMDTVAQRSAGQIFYFTNRKNIDTALQRTTNWQLDVHVPLDYFNAIVQLQNLPGYACQT
ncbi:hypothetical protein TELCIR_10945 [Teladorsagia circumcincta]|uniref:EGF-like domain-containing protein n=1 Tax=Teladorsagia circumcincta TaxID=45464 RepID=A0A2G9UCX2_TELCI|nr:hypothetical protein TELCIR_10945 [Teladorsagia circumcincta]